LARQCGFLKPNGDGCKGSVREGDAYCWAHDARYEEARRRGQSRGGRHKPSKELKDTKERIVALADAVEAGEIKTGVGSVVNQILNTYLRALSVELQITEQLELIQRLETLEANLERQNDRRAAW
jgi:hypothetical protein